MAIPLMETDLEEDLEVLFHEKIATPCDCGHETCSFHCKGHHLDLPTVDRRTGVRNDGITPPSDNPCPQAASWVASIRGELTDGHIPPSPRYLCDTCKDFWSKVDFLTLVVEPL